ncbi:MAG: TRAP transporter small permease [Spirochaetales bacterium]|nr:TRAP transporter small permease [Spirochaetales bacterium]
MTQEKKTALREGFLRADCVMQSLYRRVSYAAAVSLALVMMIAVIDVIGAKFFSKSLRGSTELIAQFNIILVFLAAPFSQIHNGFTSIEILQKKFPPGVRQFIKCLGSLLGMGFCLLISYRTLSLVTRNFHLKSKTVSGAWGIPLWPFTACLSIGFLMLAAAFCWTALREVILGSDDELETQRERESAADFSLAEECHD